MENVWAKDLLGYPNVASLHPNALQRYLAFLKELHDCVPLAQLSDEDLTEDEQTRRKEYAEGIVEWLKKCDKDAGKVSLEIYPYSIPVIYDMSNLKELLKKAYQRKVEKAQREAEEKERQAKEEAEIRERQARHEGEKKRRVAALEEIVPPLDDARRYLSDKEYQQFCDSVPGAIDAYLNRDKKAEVYLPHIWLLKSAALDYSCWTSRIKDRKEKALRLQQAETEYAQYVRQINEAVTQFKNELAKEKKPKFAYPSALDQYEPHNWCQLEMPTKQQVEKWASPHVWERVPVILKEFITWQLNWQVQALPYTKYEVLGVPCLTWCLRLLVLAEVHLRLPEKEVTREFHGYSYRIRREGQDLGCVYLGPVEWDNCDGFTTPLALLSLLETGKLHGDGVEVMETDVDSVSFHVRGCDEELTEISKSFRLFIMDVTKGKTLAQGLLSAGVIDGITAALVEEKAKLPLPQPASAGASAGQTSDDISDVIAALENLGYKKAEIKKALEATDLPSSMPTEEKIRAVLKSMGV